MTGQASLANGEFIDVYQCDVCVENAELFGESFPCAVTFGYDERGRLVRPDTPSAES